MTPRHSVEVLASYCKLFSQRQFMYRYDLMQKIKAMPAIFQYNGFLPVKPHSGLFYKPVLTVWVCFGTKEKVLSGGVEKISKVRRVNKWTALELQPYSSLDLITENKTYRLAGYIHSSDQHLFPNVTALPIPIKILSGKAQRNTLEDIAQKHAIAQDRKHMNLGTIEQLLKQHKCIQCPAFLTLFEPNKTVLTNAERIQLFRSKHAAEEKLKENVRYNTNRKNDKEYQAKYKAHKKAKYILERFPPKPPSKELLTKIIDGFSEDTSLVYLEKFGCAVCGALTPTK